MGLSNEELLAHYAAEHYERNSISPGRRHQTNVVLRAFAEMLDGRTLIEMTPSDLMLWQGARLKHITPNTVRKEQGMIRTFVSWAYTAGLMSFELTTQLKSVSDARGAVAVNRPRPYKPREIERFRELLAAKYPLAPRRGKGSLMMRRYLDGRSPFGKVMMRHSRRLQFEAQVSLALEEGLRRVEIYSLTLAEMHFDNTAVIVRTAKTKPGQRREREVPYTAHSRQCVQEWLEFRRLLSPPHDRPWLTLRNYSPTTEQTFEHFGTALKVFGPGWRWHRFRHTFATERLRAGMPLEQLQVMMGHATLMQTLAYAEIVSADVQVEADRTQGAFERALGVAA